MTAMTDDVNSDDYVSFLSEAGHSDNAIIHEFRIQYFGDESSIHAFFEGEDDRVYYLPAFRNCCQLEIVPYDCGGKPKLKSIRSEVYRIAPTAARCLFFFDRDHDDFINRQIASDENTFITDFYAIENYVTTVEAIKIILLDIVGINRSQKDFAAVIKRFAAESDQFLCCDEANNGVDYCGTGR